MSSNNYIKIKQTDKDIFKVFMADMDCGYNDNDLVGKGNTLEQAVQVANEYEEEYSRDGFYIEYGIQIELLK